MVMGTMQWWMFSPCKDTVVQVIQVPRNGVPGQYVAGVEEVGIRGKKYETERVNS